MILSTPVAFARTASQTDSIGLTNANAVIFANEALEDFHRRLIETGVDASQLQEAYIDGTANTGTYRYPADMVFLKAIQMNYANTTADNYKTALQVDVSNLASSSFGWLRTNASEDNPQFDDRGDWFEVFPTPTTDHNLTQLIRIFYYLKPTQYTAVGDTMAYPDDLDQAILGWRIAANYLWSLRTAESMVAGDAANAKYEQRVRQYIATLSRGVQQPLQATPLQISGFDF